ncbi:MAG: hypothetical protein H7Y36_08485 [Armatimonadetes bacterium]|nr:hypothetical protein [Akkermansiaceae bacterium]
MIKSEHSRKQAIPVAIAPAETVRIYPEMFELVPKVELQPKAAEQPARSVRTSPDQETAEPPASRRFIGERNTQATSDRPASGGDASMPSQAGREPRPGEQPETTESKYQDGRLDSAGNAATPAKEAPLTKTQPTPDDAPSEMVKGENSPVPGDQDSARTSIREKLFDGTHPVETPVSKNAVEEGIKPREQELARKGKAAGIAKKKAEESPKPKAKTNFPNDPAFRGNQSKTAIQGSFSRTGRSALDVVDSPMGRYQAVISRAVEKEWHLNCARRRDFIVPGYLTVRFFIQADGRVKSVQFVGDIEGGEVQKGFTLDSIRNAGIPAMPPAVKKEMGGDALELIFNFYF